jgi:uncharacterized protein YjiS (DUF1127 family)
MTSERLSAEFFDLPTLPSGLARRFLAALTRWRDRERQRAALARFNARMLRDVGVTEAELRAMNMHRSERAALLA